MIAPPYRLAEMTYAEVAATRTRRPVILLPVGATEAHGPHLPLGTDVILSRELSDRVARALGERSNRCTPLIAPALPYAVTDYAASFAGTISLTVATATALVTEICLSFIGQGFERVCLINNHLEPAHVALLHAACARVRQESGRVVAFPDQTAPHWARTLTDEFKRGACHAGSYETSLVLAAQPALVREAERAQLPEVPINLAHAMRAGVRTFEEAGATAAYFGDPRRASGDEGEAIYALLTAMVLTTIDETWPELAT